MSRNVSRRGSIGAPPPLPSCSRKVIRHTAVHTDINLQSECREQGWACLTVVLQSWLGGLPSVGIVRVAPHWQVRRMSLPQGRLQLLQLCHQHVPLSLHRHVSAGRSQHYRAVVHLVLSTRLQQPPQRVTSTKTTSTEMSTALLTMLVLGALLKQKTEHF